MAVKSIIISTYYKDTPASDIKPKDIRPTVIKVMPRPLRPSGTSLYFNFSLIPARATIAKAQPNPDPSPNATLSGNE
jgi:hypothetical protein